MATGHNHELIPFRAEHMAGVRWIEEEYARIYGLERAFSLYEKHPGVSGFCNGKLVGCGGIVVPYAGLGEAWAIAGPGMLTHKKWFHGTIKEEMHRLRRILGLRRLQAMVRKDFKTSQDWLWHLGFKYEATLLRYGVDGSDLMLYTILEDDDAHRA